MIMVETQNDGFLNWDRVERVWVEDKSWYQGETFKPSFWVRAKLIDRGEDELVDVFNGWPTCDEALRMLKEVMKQLAKTPAKAVVFYDDYDLGERVLG